MDSDNNPTVGASTLSPQSPNDDPVLHVGGNGNGSNGNKSSSRASSIEALNWSDFEDETNNEENGQVNSNLLQSIHSSALDSDSTSSSMSKLNANADKDAANGATTTQMEKTLTTDALDKDLDKTEPFEHLDELEHVIRKRRRENPDEQMITSCFSVNSDVSSTPPDHLSTAPVLDDGPIWSKGEKHYRFEENRIINQKLTFCLLLTVVLAIGLGLGNLVAYNECEAEHKIIEQQACSGKFDEKTLPASKTVMPSKATATESAIPVVPTSKIPETATYAANPEKKQEKTTQPQMPIEPTATVSPPTQRKNKPTKAKPMIDPEYKLHAQELSRVLKMLDELSRKIDQFENTTRQLGGIIMMRDEYVKPKSPKSKFLKLLDEIVHERGETGKQKKKDRADINDGGNGEPDLNAEAEKVLEKIAEAVLNVMNSNLLMKKDMDATADDEVSIEEETKVEMSENLPEDDSLFIVHTEDHPNEKPEPKDTILEQLKPSTLSIMQAHKFGEDSDMAFDYRGGDKQVNFDSYENLGSDVQDFDEFKEKHRKLLKNKDKSKSKKKQNKYKDKDNNNNPKKGKKDKKEKTEDEKYHRDKKHKGKKDYWKNGNNNGKNLVNKDWQANRAKLREETRTKFDSEYPSIQNKRNNKKFANWQIERDFAREKFREKLR